MKSDRSAPDLDPLATIRSDLVAAARRRVGRRRRQRTLALTAVSVVLLGAGAVAATRGEFSTGVSTIDQLLEESGDTGPGRSRSPDLRPGVGKASQALPVPAGQGGEDAVAVAYLSREGTVCSVQGERRRFDDGVRGSYGGCYEPESLAATLSRKGAINVGSALGSDRRIYRGFAAAEVIALRLYVDGEHVADAELTDPWTPSTPDADPLRLFVLVDEVDIAVGSDGVQPDEITLLDSRRPRIEAEFADGQRRDIDTP